MTVAEIILSSISPLFLVNSLVDLWQRHMETRTDMHHMHDRASISTATDRPAKNNITWVKIVSAYVLVLLSINVADVQSFEAHSGRGIRYSYCCRCLGRQRSI